MQAIEAGSLPRILAVPFFFQRAEGQPRPRYIVAWDGACVLGYAGIG